MKRRKRGGSLSRFVRRYSWALFGLRLAVDLVRWIANWLLS